AQSDTPPESHAQAMKSVDWKAVTDARIDIIKAALQLTPDQEKLWPPVEEAIRARADARRAHFEAMAQPREERRNSLELLRARADNLSQRADSLRKLADAWQPLYETLDVKQKQRLRVLAVFAVREMRDAVESRHMMRFDDESDEDE
ncbi:Spy/CpxP family protein refolding chaperone, partial [Rhizobiaceae sp. 2RAB30]